MEISEVSIIINGNSSPEVREIMRQSLEEKRLKEQRHKFDILYPKVIKDGNKLLFKNDLSKIIKKFRHKITSHSVVIYDLKLKKRRLIEPKDYQLNWGEPFKLLEQVENHILDLYNLINNIECSIKWFKDDCKLSATDFFSNF